MSDKDSENSDHNPEKTCQNLYDILKFTGVLLYQVSFCLMIAYYYTSNFASQYLVDIFRAFIIMRASIVFLYTMCISVFTVQAGIYKRSKIRKTKNKE